MKRTVPLWITAACGLVLIVAHFSPYTESWGDSTLIWFDILASIAFVLGGGNLLRLHLKKIAETRPGWAYSVITLVAFAVTLYVGMVKWGAPPAERQEYYGETFAQLAQADFPILYSVDVVGAEPDESGEVPRLTFQGWMSPDQKAAMMAQKETLAWQCTVERLAAGAQPPEALRGRVAYYSDHDALAFRGHMTEADQDALLKLGDSAAWRAAVQTLFEKSQVVSEVTVAEVPQGFDAAKAEAVSPAIRFDPAGKLLAIQGPMSVDERDALADQFPRAAPLPSDSPAREKLLKEITDRGPLTDDQVSAFHTTLDGGWTADELIQAVDAAGSGEEVAKTACEMYAEQQQGVVPIESKHPKGPDRPLGPEEIEHIRLFTSGEQFWPEELEDQVGADLTARQAAVLTAFLGKVPTVAERNKNLCLELMREGPLTDQQRGWLLGDYHRQLAWQGEVERLFVAAHTVKFPWSGEYAAAGTPFWWLYEYALKPLTATMFAMLAFYVASAAFRAFRAKNLEATLLLGTAFIILLGRTFAGAVATAWLPDWLSGLKIDNLTVTIMAVFNTAGNRAIFIGIALGIASTSLKVLLGIDRSYLGSGEE